MLDPLPAQLCASEHNLHTVEDALYFFPRRYRRKGKSFDPDTIDEGDRVTVVATITAASIVPMRNRRQKLLKLTIDDGEHTLEVTFFNGAYLAKSLTTGVRAIFDGTVSYYRSRITLSHPQFVVLSSDTLIASGDLKGLQALTEEFGSLENLFERDLLPIYPATKKITSWDMLANIITLLNKLPPLDDPLSPQLAAELHVCSLDEALRGIHMPTSFPHKKSSEKRLRTDEAFTIQTVLARRRADNNSQRANPIPLEANARSHTLRQSLPFTLTQGQQDIITDIRADLANTHPMNRLLQGDVGSGKTLVALLAMCAVVDNGGQAVLLAPTEVLATQHHRTITDLLGDMARQGIFASDLPTPVTLLTGSLSAANKREALLDCMSGQASIIIGTHALLQDHVEFCQLDLVVVDEQHRFGVQQRDNLRTKGHGNNVPHLLAMTATPIPRTIAMTFFGDIDVSTLTEKPARRAPITTTVVPLDKPGWVDRVWERIGEETSQNNAVFIVTSRIGDTSDPHDSPETVSAKEMHEIVTTRFPHLTVEMVHGRIPAAEKDRIMTAMKNREVDILVSTTVIEVGIDIPHATLMLIWNADRFGISQLHQLRGRVGRADLPGLCLLATAAPEDSDARTRLDAIAATTDGFHLAELDLHTRKEGKLLGDAQSGNLSSFKLLDVLTHRDDIDNARACATRLIDTDPTLKHHPALKEIITTLEAQEESTYLDKT